jgi:hypothetical protein
MKLPAFRHLEHLPASCPQCARTGLRWCLLCGLAVGMWPIVWLAAIHYERGRSEERAMLRIIEDR